MVMFRLQIFRAWFWGAANVQIPPLVLKRECHTLASGLAGSGCSNSMRNVSLSSLSPVSLCVIVISCPCCRQFYSPSLAPMT